VLFPLVLRGQLGASLIYDAPLSTRADYVKFAHMHAWLAIWEFTKQVYIYFPDIFGALDVFIRRLFGVLKLEIPVRETLTHASMSKIIAVVVQYICMWIVIHFLVDIFVSELSDFVHEKQMIELNNSRGIKMWSPRLNDFRKSGIFFQSCNKYKHY